MFFLNPRRTFSMLLYLLSFQLKKWAQYSYMHYILFKEGRPKKKNARVYRHLVTYYEND